MINWENSCQIFAMEIIWSSFNVKFGYQRDYIWEAL